ncbi:MAG: hypothetical protein WDW36_003273 [Sanguina aurantia]
MSQDPRASEAEGSSAAGGDGDAVAVDGRGERRSDTEGRQSGSVTYTAAGGPILRHTPPRQQQQQQQLQQLAPSASPVPKPGLLASTLSAIGSVDARSVAAPVALTAAQSIVPPVQPHQQSTQQQQELLQRQESPQQQQQQQQPPAQPHRPTLSDVAGGLPPARLWRASNVPERDIFNRVLNANVSSSFSQYSPGQSSMYDDGATNSSSDSSFTPARLRDGAGASTLPAAPLATFRRGLQRPEQESSGSGGSSLNSSLEHIAAEHPPEQQQQQQQRRRPGEDERRRDSHIVVDDGSESSQPAASLTPHSSSGGLPQSHGPPEVQPSASQPDDDRNSSCTHDEAGSEAVDVDDMDADEVDEAPDLQAHRLTAQPSLPLAGGGSGGSSSGGGGSSGGAGVQAAEGAGRSFSERLESIRREAAVNARAAAQERDSEAGGTGMGTGPRLTHLGQRRRRLLRELKSGGGMAGLGGGGRGLGLVSSLSTDSATTDED